MGDKREAALGGGKSLDGQRAALVLELLEIQERIEPELARIASIKAELEELELDTFAVPGTDYKLNVSQSRTFKPALFAAKYPPTSKEIVRKFYTLVPDRKKIEDALPPADFEAFKEASKKSVKVL